MNAGDAMVVWLEAPGCFLCYKLSLAGGKDVKGVLVLMIQFDLAEFR